MTEINKIIQQVKELFLLFLMGKEKIGLVRKICFHILGLIRVFPYG